MSSDTRFQRYKITKIIYAKSILAALVNETQVEPIEVTLDEPVGLPESEQIGFHTNGRK